ncbi:GGDEF-domain containing protein [Roseobacter denitrificans]|uniref:GGDEF/EAL domain protein n=1 Tax=Roseobacter denitrificans (strain ATCC 33942 / OCh 114) TaxID=375451 RepID=Q169L2_ROSDO|nr:EAL domain-containing protein [Roseobacter denitrificans]ABG31331.1 GGDEF/EAL domain protein [Roseobacter denitrificans OCh 114]AVL54363.1 GGDEF-domain containing protein [Roseobacter denitrificans]SFF99641.1 diguanylate cyclase/phosphodiesterase [Roseobacter denitrificans OCh 114]
MIPAQIFNQINDKCTEGLALALASSEDGAVMEIQWSNKAFTRITGYTAAEALGERGTILIGPDMGQGVHLYIIEKLMKWENFSTKSRNNRKNGEVYWQRMSWVHLSEAETGNHWWLCSIIELEEEHAAPASQVLQDPAVADQAAFAKALEQVERLEKENTRLHQLAKSVAKDANEDALTGLSNRRHFEVELKTWIENLKKHGTEFAVIYIDLDRFKFVNDTLGHDAGDRLLVSVADMLRDLTGDCDLVARLGGDEFVILRPLAQSALNISSLADDIVGTMQAPFACDGKSTACSASVGVAIANKHMEHPEQVVADADEALYHAKSQGKGRWSFFTEEMHAKSIATKKLASDLLLACERSEFIPYFQPLIDAQSGKIVSAEMLVRWAHPTQGILAPAAFLDTAANMGILKRIDEIVFASVHGALSRFDDAGVDLPRVAVNVSAARLADPTFIHDIKSSGINPQRLTIEILESVYLDRMGDVVRWTIDELDELGVTIALDDFGTGHASVSGLLKIRPAILKVDRHFIQPIVEQANTRPLVASIVGIGKSLGMRVVAEGVETEEHARLVTEMGCDYLQGFYFGKPMSESDLRNRLIESGGQFWSPQPVDENRKVLRNIASAG